MRFDNIGKCMPNAETLHPANWLDEEINAALACSRRLEWRQAAQA